MSQTFSSLATLRAEDRVPGRRCFFGMTYEKNCSAVFWVGRNRQPRDKNSQHEEIVESAFRSGFQVSSGRLPVMQTVSPNIRISLSKPHKPEVILRDF